MKEKWNRKLPFVKVIEKGVLHLDQTNSVGKERKRKRKDRKKRKKRERKKVEERSSNIYWSLVFQQEIGSTGQEVSWTALQEVGVLSYSG